MNVALNTPSARMHSNRHHNRSNTIICNLYNQLTVVALQIRDKWHNFNETIKIKTVIYMVLISLFIWYCTIIGNIFGLNDKSLATIKSTTMYAFGLRDYNEVYSPTFVWKFGIGILSDKHDEIKYLLQTVISDKISDLNSFNNICNGDIIWIRDLQIFDFVNKILPNIDKYFTLIIVSNLDWIIPFHYDMIPYMTKYKYLNKNNENLHIFDKLIRNKYLLYIFAENYDASLNDKYDNIEAIPLGLDFKTAYIQPFVGLTKFGHNDAPSMQEYKIKQLLNSDKITKLKDRKLQIYMDSSLNIIEKNGIKNYKKYLNIWINRFGTDWIATNNTKLIINLYSDRNRWRKLWYRSWVIWNINNSKNKKLFYIDKYSYNQYDAFLKRSKYIFALSPFGNGFDCHRTYESLLFGNIVIIQSSPLDKLFKKHDLPIVIIKDFKQINKTMLNYWYQKYKNKISINNQQTKYKLTNEYWISYIRQKTKKKLKAIHE